MDNITMVCIYLLDLFLCYLPDPFQLASSFLFSSCCHWQVMCFYPGLHRAQDPSVAWSFTTATNSTLNTNVCLLKGSSMHVRRCWLWLPYNVMWPSPATSVVLQWHKAIFTSFPRFLPSFENPDMVTRSLGHLKPLPLVTLTVYWERMLLY